MLLLLLLSLLEDVAVEDVELEYSEPEDVDEDLAELLLQNTIPAFAKATTDRCLKSFRRQISVGWRPEGQGGGTKDSVWRHDEGLECASEWSRPTQALKGPAFALD